MSGFSTAGWNICVLTFKDTRAEVCETQVDLLGCPVWTDPPSSRSNQTLPADPYPELTCVMARVSWGAEVPCHYWLPSQPCLTGKFEELFYFKQFPLPFRNPKHRALCQALVAAPRARSDACETGCLFLSFLNPSIILFVKKRCCPLFVRNEPTQTNVLIHHTSHGTWMKLLVAPSGQRHHTWPQPAPKEAQGSRKFSHDCT